MHYRSLTKAALFGAGLTPTIALINQATTPLGLDINQLAGALQTYIGLISAVWGTPANVVVRKTPLPSDWVVLLQDEMTVQGALGYHNLTLQGLPKSYVGVKICLKYDGTISMCVSHEIVEMLIDPGINTCVYGPGGRQGRFFAFESADPCEQQGFLINGIAMSDFIYPAWFEGFRSAGSIRFDYLNLIDHPFQILQGGYCSYFDVYTRKWDQSFGSKQAREYYYARKGRPGSRTFARLHSDESVYDS